jgi:hypothetical protein
MVTMILPLTHALVHGRRRHRAEDVAATMQRLGFCPYGAAYTTCGGLHWD